MDRTVRLQPGATRQWHSGYASPFMRCLKSSQSAKPWVHKAYPPREYSLPGPLHSRPAPSWGLHGEAYQVGKHLEQSLLFFGHECRNCRILPQPAKGPFGWAPQASPRRPRLKGAFEGGGRCNQGARFRCQVWLCFVQHETCFVHAGFIWAGPRGADKRWHPTYLHSVRTSRYARCAQLSISQEA